MTSEGSKVHVVVRVRPLIEREQGHATQQLVVHPAAASVGLRAPSESKKTDKTYSFDYVFGPNSKQIDVWKGCNVEQMIKALLRGYNCTVFAYGQTGSGKTFTMEGYNYETAAQQASSSSSAPRPDIAGTDKVNIGVVPRAIFGLFRAISEKTEGQSGDIAAKRHFRVRCSFVQIYNEQIYDLLNPSHLANNSRSANARAVPGLRIRWSEDSQFYVENLFITEVESPQQALKCFQKGIKRRMVASHRMNAASSRSHCLFTLYVSCWSPNKPEEVTESKFSLVDLAGSERVSQTNATGQTLKESIGINRSLFVLRKVIVQLARPEQGAGHVPYRDSKLTALLKDSLGGNSLTLMIACLSPSDTYYEENASTLAYAAMASRISNKPIVNEDSRNRIIRSLREENDLLKVQLRQAHAVIRMALEDGSLTTSTVAEVYPQYSEGPADSTEALTPHGIAVRSQRGRAALEDSGPSAAPLFAQAEPTEQLPPAVPVPQASVRSVREVAASRSLSRAATEAPSRASSSSTHSRAVPQRPSRSALTLLKHEASRVHRQLKLDIVHNVKLLKDMFDIEQQLRERLDEETARNKRVVAERNALQAENTSLREQMEVLQFVLSTVPEAEADGVTELPEYGALSSANGEEVLRTAVEHVDKSKLSQMLIRILRENMALQEEREQLRMDAELQAYQSQGPSTAQTANSSAIGQRNDSAARNGARPASARVPSSPVTSTRGGSAADGLDTSRSTSAAGMTLTELHELLQSAGRQTADSSRGSARTRVDGSASGGARPSVQTDAPARAPGGVATAWGSARGEGTPTRRYRSTADSYVLLSELHQLATKSSLHAV